MSLNPQTKEPTQTFHLLGLAHLPTRKEISCCAFTQLIERMSRMLKSKGHRVIFYGAEGSEVDCDEFVPCVSTELLRQTYGDYDYSKAFFKGDGADACYAEFNRATSSAIKARASRNDILLITYGLWQKPIVDAVNLPLTCECVVGYSGIFANKHVFPSYAWMHYLYGKTGITDGVWYDAVIQHYFDVADFPAGKQDGGYYLYAGRLIDRKGVATAVNLATHLGVRLVVAGQGDLPCIHNKPNIEYVGSVGPTERARLMGGATALICPTYYIEPFGAVAVEAQLCGTPVISTDWGAFSETVQHGVTGYRCRTMADFVQAAELVKGLDSTKIREYAIANYSMEQVANMYEQYWSMLQGLADPAGWGGVSPSQNFNWLARTPA